MDSELVAEPLSTVPDHEEIKEDRLHESSSDIKHNKATDKAGTTQEDRNQKISDYKQREKLMNDIEIALEAPPKPDNSYRYDDIKNIKKAFESFISETDFLDFMKKLLHEKILDRELFMLFCHVYYFPNPENYYKFFRSSLFSSNSQDGKYIFIKESISMIEKEINKKWYI